MGDGDAAADEVRLPIGLQNAIEAGNCVLFLGAGVGLSAKDKDGNAAPDGRGLAAELAARFGIDYEGEPDLSTIAQVIEIRRSRADLQSFLSERFSGLEPGDDLIWLCSLTWRAIFTTNFDDLIQRSYEAQTEPRQQPVIITSSSEFVSYDPRFEVPVYHLHGALFRTPNPDVLITRNDYSTFRERRRMLFEVLKLDFATLPVLYVGYSNRDPNWSMVRAEMREEFAPAAPPPGFRVAPSTPALDREILTAEGIATISADLPRFRYLVTASLGDLRVDPRSLSEIEKTIPVHLRDAFSESPAAVARLMNSWHYLNQEDFNVTPNTADFLAGDHPNWGLIASGQQFEREVEEPILNELLDYATASDPGVRYLRLLAPAGYGVSTALMSIGVRLVREGAGHVFVHRRGSPFLESDVEFASQLFDAPTFILVDNAVDAGQPLFTSGFRLRETKQSACFVLGARLNEWRQARLRITGIEFQIEPLSDPEIERLIDCLSASHSLGVLAELDRPMQRAVIREKHGKELLVAMREATAGMSFAAIIEDEYRRIPDQSQKKLYAAVCGFYRLRSYARDQVIADVLECNLADIYRDVEAVEGVVRWETIDEALGIQAARARHHVISQIVWERAVPPLEKQDILLAALSALNLNVGIDVRAFDHFVRSEETLVDIRTFEARTEFFERACRKDPRSPYVRQHYARMLRREGKLELALSQVRAGLELSPDARALRHTLGLILHDLAIQTESVELARRHMAQSEQEFRRVISLSPRDEYGYHGLADLYFSWAKRAGSVDESADYVRRSEDTISEGLRQVSDKEALWILSSQIADWLGNHPQAIEALKQGIEASAVAGVARYLLAREQLRANEPGLAAETIRPVVEAAPDDYRPSLVYALALHDSGREYGECVAVLRQAELSGSRDPRFVPTLAGMLFMDQRFGEAEKVFEEAARRDFSFEQRKAVHFLPKKAGRPVWLSGTVESILATFSFVRVPGYPDFFFPGSRYQGIEMRRGLAVRFRPGFTMQGAQVVDPEIEERAPDP